MATLTVLMGLPGAGKSTWAVAHGAGQVLCSTDRLRTDEGLGQAGAIAYLRSLHTRAARALAAGQDVIADGCHVRRYERTRWRNLAATHGAATHLVVLHLDLTDALAVQRDRVHGVDEAVMRADHRHLQQSLRRLAAEGWGRITHVDPAAPVRNWIAADTP